MSTNPGPLLPIELLLVLPIAAIAAPHASGADTPATLFKLGPTPVEFGPVPLDRSASRLAVDSSPSFSPADGQRAGGAIHATTARPTSWTTVTLAGTGI